LNAFDSSLCNQRAKTFTAEFEERFGLGLIELDASTM
jgi:hypothetical protein